jgi:myo-inositol 2-dehydrogenase / D-chiro-inositol 1-dehydrogenase
MNTGVSRGDGVPLGIGVVGCGFVAAQLHLPALRRLSGARVVAAADVDRDRLSAVADRFAIPVRAGDWHEVVVHPAVDVVAVCVPPAVHADVVLSALAAGKHVFVEKPLATTLGDCDRMIERAEESNRVVMVGFNLRWHRLVRRAQAIVAQGRLGRLALVRSTFTSNARHTVGHRPWRLHRELGGGVLTEIGIHHYDLWRFLLRCDIEEVTAITSPDDSAATLTARLTGGVLASATFGETTGGRNEIDVFGDAGQLHLSCFRFDGLEVADVAELYPGSLGTRLRRMERLVRDLPQIMRAISRGGDYVDSYRVEWGAFLAAVHDGRPVGPSLRDGRRALEVALAAIESATTGRPVACGGARERSK